MEVASYRLAVSGRGSTK